MSTFTVKPIEAYYTNGESRTFDNYEKITDTQHVVHLQSSYQNYGTFPRIYFPELTKLCFAHDKINRIPEDLLLLMPKLEVLTFIDTDIDQIPLSVLNVLRKLTCNKNKFLRHLAQTDLVLPKLEKLMCVESAIEYIAPSIDCPNLKSIICNGSKNMCTLALDYINLPEISSLLIDNCNHLSELAKNVMPMPNLKRLNICHNKFRELLSSSIIPDIEKIVVRCNCPVH